MTTLTKVLDNAGGALLILGDDQRVAHDQAAARQTAELAQCLVKLHQRFANERNAPVSTRQTVQNVAVKHKNAVKLAAAFERQMQRSVVADTQIASKPHQSGIKRVFHVHR